MLAPGFLEGVDRKGRVLWHALEQVVRDEPRCSRMSAAPG